MKTILMILLFTVSLQASDWKYVGEYNTGRIMNIKCQDNICYACTDRSGNTIVIKSYDYGNSWEIAVEIDRRESKEPYLYSPEFLEVVDTNYLFIRYRDPYSTIMKSTDGGYTFKKNRIKTVEDRWIKSIKMFDRNRGIASTSPRIYFTNDGWETTSSRIDTSKLGGIQQFFEPQIKDDNSLYYMNFDVLSEYNVETGDSIQLYNLVELSGAEFGEAGVSDIEIINDTLGFAVGSKATGFGNTKSDLMFRTKGSLKDWELQFDSIPDPEHAWGLHEVSFFDEFNGVAVGPHGRIYLTKDGGNTWIAKSILKQLDELGDPGYTACLAWSDTVPILGTYKGHFFRYEGDFFDFTQTPRLYHPTTSEPVCGSGFDFPPSSVGWEASADAQYYRIELDDNYKYKTPIFIADSLTDLSVSLPVLPCGREYFWRVRSYNEELKSRWSDNCTFSIKAYKPTLTYPPNDTLLEENTSILRWESSDASGIYEELYYEIQLSKSENFDSTIFEMDGIEDYKVLIEGFDWSTTYFWRVRGYNNELKNNWSDYRTFATGVTGIDTNIEYSYTYENNKLTFTGDIIGRSYKIMDLHGKEVTGGIIAYTPFSIEMSGYPSGTYVFNIVSDNGKIATGKFIIVK